MSVRSEQAESRTAKSHIYQALNEGCIRLLCLQPGLLSSPLRAYLQTVSLQNVPSWRLHHDRWRYELDCVLASIPKNTELPELESSRLSADVYIAISYVWGAPLFTHELRIEDDCVLMITESLHSALQNFRSEDKVTRFWADAVCIDRANDVEKAVQVAMMAQIYRQAYGVMVWLGPAEAGDALAFATISFYPHRPTMIGTEAHNWLSDDALTSMLHTLGTHLTKSSQCPCCRCSFACDPDRVSAASSGLLAMGHLLARSWFTRLWVVQEVLGEDSSSRPGVKLCCGNHSAPFDEFSQFVTLELLYLLHDAFRKSDTIGACVRECLDGLRNDPRARTIMNNIDNLLSPNVFITTNYKQSHLKFWTAFSSLSYRACRDPRDRIFAVRHLLGLEHFSALMPDYTVTATHLFRKFPCTMI